MQEELPKRGWQQISLLVLVNLLLFRMQEELPKRGWQRIFGSLLIPLSKYMDARRITQKGMATPLPSQCLQVFLVDHDARRITQEGMATQFYKKTDVFFYFSEMQEELPKRGWQRIKNRKIWSTKLD